MFEVGDRIKCTEQRQFCFPKVGEFYNIVRFDWSSDISIKDKTGYRSECTYPQGMFVKVGFEVGNRVKWENSFDQKEECGCIDEINTKSEIWVNWDNRPRTWSTEEYWTEQGLKVIKEATMFKVGDEVRTRDDGKGFSFDPAIGVIKEIVGEDRPMYKVKIYGQSDLWNYVASELTLLREEEKMSKYQELKERIENVKGWDKEADDILAEIFPDNSGEIYRLTIPVWKIHTGSCIEIRNALNNELIKSFICSNQCEKLNAFKKALLWFLDHSGIKDEKEEKIKELEYQRDTFATQVRSLNLQIEELRR